MSTQLIKSSALKDVVQSDIVKNRLKEIMGERAPQFAAALVQIVNQSFQLQKCEPNSVLGAAITAAALDLSVDPNLGESHIVPYGDKAQFQIGFKGFIQLAMRSGEYKSFGSTVVKDGELIHYDELTGELVVDKSKKASDKVIGYAAKFKLLNGFERGEFWTVDEIEEHAKAYSKSYRYSKGDAKKEQTCLWITKRDEMAIKTVEKSLLNHYGPKSIQMKKAIKMDGGAVIDADKEQVSYIDTDEPVQPMASKPEFATSEEPAISDVEIVPESSVAPRGFVGSKPSKPEALPVKQAVKPAVQPSAAYNPVKAVKGFIQLAGLKDEEVIRFLEEIGSIDSGIKTIEELNDKSPDVLKMLHEQHSDILAKIKEGK